MIDLADVYSTTFQVRDAAGALTTPASNVCTITLPDGTSVTPALTVASTGVLRLDYPTTVAGRHAGRLTTVNPDSAYTFSFDVDEAAPTGIVSLSDVRANLGMMSTASDEKVRFYIDVATDFVESRIGPVVRRTIVETIWPSDGRLWLRRPLAVPTVVVSALGYPGDYVVGDMHLDPTLGTVSNGPYGTFCYPVTVTYLAGMTSVPAKIRDAALLHVRWKWERQRGAASPVALAQGAEFDIGTPATVPFEILEALESYTSAAVA